jgi:hypothetical protein
MLRKKIVSISVILFCLGATQCTKQKSSPIVRPDPGGPVPASITPPPERLGEVSEMRPPVTFRRRDDVVWQDAAPFLPLNAYDILQTHAKASAKLTISSRSEVMLPENTQIILNPVLLDHPRVDRVVLRNGKLNVKTNQEFWLLTSAVLFRVRAKDDKKIARAELSVTEGKTLRFVLQEGVGAMVRKKEGTKFDTTPVAVGKVVTMPAPKALEMFGADENSTAWTFRLPDMKGDRRVPVSVTGNLVIQSPKEYSSIEGSQVDVKGMTTGAGGEIRVNGKSVPCNEKNEFTATVPLTKGPNDITVQWVRTDGTSAFNRFRVIRAK